MSFKYVVAIKEYGTPIYMEQVEFDVYPDWKELYLTVTGDDFFGNDPNHRRWIEAMPKLIDDARSELLSGNIEVEILHIT